MKDMGLNVLSVVVSKFPSIELFENIDVYEYQKGWTLYNVEYTELGDGSRYYWSEVATETIMWTDVETIPLHEVERTNWCVGGWTCPTYQN